jgi:hypothetical protein
VFTVGASDNYFEMIKIRPRLGRLLASRSDQALNAAPEVVLSHNFWARRLNSGPAAIGQTIWLSGVAFTGLEERRAFRRLCRISGCLLESCPG